MAFKLTMETGSAAFGEEDHERNGEIVRILRDVASKIMDGQSQGRAVDGNGNVVGGWSVDSSDAD